uniref:Uncharacterized protein n=1 Tax=Aegilops tauschii subsp. strangulata TaxID=200361 RepID=A0A452Z3V3_AEGTS
MVSTLAWKRQKNHVHQSIKETSNTYLTIGNLHMIGSYWIPE